MKKISNIVFYEHYDSEGKKVRKACVFYSNGTVEDVSYEDGIKACQEVVRERHITSKEEFKKLINNDIIHVMSEDKLIQTFNDYFPRKETDEIDLDDLEEQEEDTLDEDEFIGSDYDDGTSEFSFDDNEDEDEDEDDLEDQEEDSFDEDEFIGSNYDDGTSEFSLDDNGEQEEDAFDEEIEDADVIELQNSKTEKKGIFGLLQRGIEKIKKSKLVRKIGLCVGAFALFIGGYVCGARQTKEGKMLNSNIQTEDTNATVNSNNDVVAEANSDSTVDALVVGDNNFYDNYTFEELVEVTNSKTQKSAMKKLKQTINKFNNKFAQNYLEEGKDVRAALTFDELVALQHAYNDYSKNQIAAYFNGVVVNAADMEKNYKSATLQLMGAHVIETRENPVDMSKIIKGDKEKEFYEKYHNMFLSIKEADGKEKIAKVKAFRKEIRKDFPITKKVRTEGIMHADAYNSIESYKLSVVPMIAASEMMFQNLETDYTLSDSEIDFLNDIGLCNYAQDKFERIETITLSTEEDNTNPLYEQYRNSVINELKENGHYVIDDEQRDLSRLDAFQKQVNWHFDADENNYSKGERKTSTKTSKKTKTWKTTHTSEREETTTESKEIPTKEKEKVDEEIAKKNKEAKKKAKKGAAAKQKEMQEEADKEAEAVNDQVKEDEKDLQEKIDDANEKIDENNKDENTDNDNPVNEADFGDHGVDFDDKHSDKDGNLDESVEDITTDGTGDQTDEELPDPDKTGADFDKKANNESSESSESKNKETSSSYESEKPDTSQNIAEYEEAVDKYIEDLAEQTDENTDVYEYVK